MAECLLPKQDVVGSNPITRSTRLSRWMSKTLPPLHQFGSLEASYKLDIEFRGDRVSTLLPEGEGPG